MPVVILQYLVFRQRAGFCNAHFSVFLFPSCSLLYPPQLLAASAMWIEQFLGLCWLTEPILIHWVSEKQSEKTLVSVEGIFFLPNCAGQSPTTCYSLLGREGNQAPSWLSARRGGWEVSRQRRRPLFSHPRLPREILDCSPSAQGSSLAAAFPPSSRQAQAREPAGERAGGNEWWWRTGGRECFRRVFPKPPTPQPRARGPVHCNSSGCCRCFCLSRDRPRGAHGATVRGSFPVHWFPQNCLS